MIDEPAAAAICVLARMRSQPLAAQAVSSRHTRPCGWDIYPLPELIRWVEDFNHRDAHGSLSQRFRALPRDVQRTLVERAMYDDVQVSA